MSKTIQETIESLHSSLKDYIEATYHIGDAKLIAQRQALLDRVGVTHQIEPGIEATSFHRQIRKVPGPFSPPEEQRKP